jgi:hypothetical protein
MNIINLMGFSFFFFSGLLLNGCQLGKKKLKIMGMENNIVEASSSSM